MSRKREIPSHVKSFHLTRTSTAAVTFYFRPDGGSGWALATINDDTHELVIQSDWGSWSHRWPAAGMATGPDGRRCTLMEFIADRSEDYCDYLADKLTSREEREQFDSYKTVDHLRACLLKNRLEQGRQLIDYYADCDDDERISVSDDPATGLPYGAYERRTVRCGYGRNEEWILTKATARSLYDELDDIKHIDNVQDFVKRYYEIEGYAWIADNIEFEGDLQYEPSPHYYQLLHGILPAVVRAAEKHVREREANVPCMAPEQRETRAGDGW